MKNLLKKGFTLAEVLITLGIIGVIAAMTMPTVIANYQKQTTVSKIKKFYTNMSQVLQMAKVDNGDFSTWTYNDSQDFYNKYIKPYIKNVERVETNIHFHGLFAGGVRFIFADGTQAIFSSWSNIIGPGNQTPTLVFDTEANKHSNANSNYIRKPTHERFYFFINNQGQLEPPYMNVSRDAILNRCKNRLKSDSINTNNGHHTCSTLIIKDGWKISDDYPW